MMLILKVIADFNDDNHHRCIVPDSEYDSDNDFDL